MSLPHRLACAWGLCDRSDPAGLPPGAAILIVVLLLLSPATNTIVRSTEAEAGALGPDTSREALGFASAAMRLSTYRKLAPGPIGESVFRDHPSGHDRVHRSMLWLKEHP